MSRNRFTAEQTVPKLLRALPTPSQAMETKRGQPAVGFRLPEFTGRWHQLADYSGHWLLLVFHRHLA